MQVPSCCTGLVPALTPDRGLITSSCSKSPRPSYPHTEARQPLRLSGQVPGMAPTPYCYPPMAPEGWEPASMPLLPSPHSQFPSSFISPNTAPPRHPQLRTLPPTPQPPQADSSSQLPHPLCPHCFLGLFTNHCAELGTHHLLQEASLCVLLPQGYYVCRFGPPASRAQHETWCPQYPAVHDIKIPTLLEDQQRSRS